MTPIEGRFGGRFDVRDPSTQQPVSGKTFGSYSGTTTGDPQMAQQWAQQKLTRAINEVVAQKLMQNQIAVPTIAHSMPALIPEIIQASGLAADGVQISQLQIQVQIDPPANAPQVYSGPMPPDPMQSAANAYKQALADELDPRNKEYGVRVKVGGFNLDASTDGGFDTDGLKQQLGDKAKSTVIWWGIGCAVIGLVGVLLLGIGWYAYTQVVATSAPAASKAVADATWDGTTPFVCTGGKNMRLSNVTASKGITANANCVLELVNVNVTAPTALSALGGAQVTVKGGSLTGTIAAVSALGSGTKVTLQGTTLSGPKKSLGGAEITGP